MERLDVDRAQLGWSEIRIRDDFEFPLQVNIAFLQVSSRELCFVAQGGLVYTFDVGNESIEKAKYGGGCPVPE